MANSIEQGTSAESTGPSAADPGPANSGAGNTAGAAGLGAAEALGTEEEQGRSQPAGGERGDPDPGSSAGVGTVGLGAAEALGTEEDHDTGATGPGAVTSGSGENSQDPETWSGPREIKGALIGADFGGWDSIRRGSANRDTDE